MSKLKINAEQATHATERHKNQKTQKPLLSPGAEPGLAHQHHPSTALLFVKNLISSSDIPLFSGTVSLKLALTCTFEGRPVSFFSHKILSARRLHCHCSVGWTGLDCFMQLLPPGLWHPCEQCIC